MKNKDTQITSVDSNVLLALLRQNGIKEKRIEAIWVLGKRKDKRAIPVLISSIQDTDKGVRWESAKALSNIAHRSSIKPLMHLMRRGKTSDIRHTATYALSFMFSKHFSQAARALLDVLKNKNEKAVVRAQAAEGLGNLQYRVAIKELMNALDDKNIEVRYWAVFALGKLGNSRAILKLREIARRDHGVLPKWGSIRKEARAAIKVIERRYSQPI